MHDSRDSGLTLRPAREALLSDFSLSVERGTLHAIVGPNGAGKTTLLSAILGLVPFEGASSRTGRGEGGSRMCRSNSRSIDAACHRRRFSGADPAEPSCVPRRFRGTRSRISRLLERVSLSGIRESSVSALSGGELRRVLLANALDPLPELLILDEPARGLDEAAAALARRNTDVAERGDDRVDGLARFRTGPAHRRSRARA